MTRRILLLAVASLVLPACSGSSSTTAGGPEAPAPSASASTPAAGGATGRPAVPSPLGVSPRASASKAIPTASARTSPTAAPARSAPATTMAAPTPAPRKTSPPPSATAAPTRTPAPTVGTSSTALAIRDFTFTPRDLLIPVGTTVRATNYDGATHDWTSRTPMFASGELRTNASYSFTFRTAGRFDFLCTIHPSMTGSVTVN